MQRHFVFAIIIACAASAWAQETVTTKAAAQPVAPSRIVAVTVYQTNALVTRDVTAPETAGVVELVVGPLPPSTVASSLYSEGTDGLRVLTTRYRTRVVQENIQEEVRKLEAQMKDLRREADTIQRHLVAIEQNTQFVGKLESFTAGSLQHLTEKGMLNSDAVTKISDYIMNTRTARSTEVTELRQKLEGNQEKQQFAQREMSKLSGASDKTIREAIVVVEKAAGAGKAKLHYLVTAASWRPHYKLRAAREKADVQLEYLAAIMQQSGEDWSDVNLTLSTAQPLLNSAPPELAMLEVTVGGGRGSRTAQAYQQDAEQVMKESWQLRQQAQTYSNTLDQPNARLKFNEAAAMDQSFELLNPTESKGKPAAKLNREGQSVTFRLTTKLSVPWRDDEQLIEVTRIGLKADYFYKAVPVLTPHVYRLATLLNDSKYVILPGEATMYQDTDFVGRSALPLVAVGEQFTAGFGVDPQLQVARDLVTKTKSIQGGNHVLKYDYRITISSYKSEAVKFKLWDRIPHSEAEAVSVTFISSNPELSKDALYVQHERPRDLLRWDLEIQPNTKNEKATVITYQFKLELDRNMRLPTPAPVPGVAPSKSMDDMYDLQLKNR